MLLFPSGGVPFLPLIFPIYVMFAVERGEEVQALLQVGEACVVGKHCVLMAGEDSEPMPVDVLSVVCEILPYNPKCRAGEDAEEEVDDPCFLLETPVAFLPIR